MAKSLGGVALPSGLDWPDRYEYAPVASRVARTLGGRVVVFSSALVQGQRITLEARDKVAVLQEATVTALQALAAVPGATYTLDWDGEQHLVMFDTSGQALRLERIHPLTIYFGAVALITV